MANHDLTSNQKNGFKRWLIILAALPSIIIAGWFCFGVHPQLNKIKNTANKTMDLNKNFFAEIQEIETIGSQGYLGINILTKEDMQSLKKILFALKSEVDKAIEFSHQDTINIVDRVNLYVTIGIVLLTLLGVFVPVIVQNFGGQELKEKQKEMNERMKSINDRINSINSEVLHIPPLRLSYSLLRALDKDLIRWYSKNPKDNRKHMHDTFEKISKDLETCKEKGVLSSSNKDILKNSLRDFNLHLGELLVAFNDREFLDHFRTLRNTIESFINNDDLKSEEEHFSAVIKEVEKIKNSL